MKEKNKIGRRTPNLVEEKGQDK